MRILLHEKVVPRITLYYIRRIITWSERFSSKENEELSSQSGGPTVRHTGGGFQRGPAGLKSVKNK